MFFRTYTTASSSQMEAALAKKDVTLRELMDEDDIINECKLQNKALMEFLVKPDVIEELITLTTVEPSADIDECTRFKYSNIACEILTCDVPSINERLASDEALLSKLCAFIDCEPPLNPLLASFFSKIMGVLFAKKAVQNWLSYEMTCLQVLDFLKAKENFISMLLRHLGTSAIMDLTLKLMTQVEGEVRENNLNWLNSQQIMQSLVSLLDPSVESERHYNVAQLLCDFIKTSRQSLKHNLPNPLLNTLESPETISLLIDHMLSEHKVESCIVGGIQVLLQLLELFEYSHEDSSLSSGRYNAIVAVNNRLGDFQLLLLDPPKKKPITTTFGLLDPPFGNTRLQITKLFATLISTKNHEVIPKLIKLGTFNVLLDLFFQFPWNNFLHTQVENCINFALTPAKFDDADNEALYEDLVLNCKLPERILEAWKQNNQKTEDKIEGQGYMGHLMNIAQLLKKNVVDNILKDKFPELGESFSTFTQTTLKDVMNIRSTVLGGEPKYSDEEDDEFGDADYPDELEEQDGLPPPNPMQKSRTFSARYELNKSLSLNKFVPRLMDNYEFNDDFNDTDTMQTIMDHRMNMNFNLSEGIAVQPEELFKQVCAQNISTLDDAQQIFEDFMNTLDPGQIVEDIMNLTGEKEIEHSYGAYNIDSEEEDDSPPVDEDDAFLRPDDRPATNSESAVAPISMDNVWSNNEKTATDADNIGWANFSSASFANFEANFENATNDAQPAVASDIKVENLETNSDKELPDYFDSERFSQMLKEALSPLTSSIESPLKDIPESEIQHTNKELRLTENEDVDIRSSPNVLTHESADKLREQHGDI